MIQSMTGYGKGVVQMPSKTITIELKSLNSKSFDLNMRMPSSYREKELEIRDLLSKSLQRGKVDFTLNIEATDAQTTSQLNEVVIKKYIAQLANIVNGDPVELLKMAVRMPDALKTEHEEIDDKEYKAITKALDKALKAINKYRSHEGKTLENDFRKRSKAISELLDQVVTMDPERISGVKNRLRKALADLKENVDENRFEQELIYYLEKFDITEEKVRLKNHLDYFEKSMDSSDSNGKKLAFITQEIGREINTIGSKANYAPMQQLVVQMKDELEKIKEQAINGL